MKQYDNLQKPYLSSRSTNVGESKVCNTTLILSSRCPTNELQNISVHNVLEHELLPVPMHMFRETSDIWICKAKSSLMQQLQIEVSAKRYFM